MRRKEIAAAILTLVIITPPAARSADPASYSLIMAGSRCASAISRSATTFASAWVCSGVQVANGGAQTVDPDRVNVAGNFGCIAIADFRSGQSQRACGAVADDALTGDPALQEGTIDFFLRKGSSVLAARITLTGVGQYLNDHFVNEFGNATSGAEHDSQVYGIARIYRAAKLSGFVAGSGMGVTMRGNRGSLSTGVSAIALIRVDEPAES